MAEPLGAIARLIQELGKLPGIGPKSAERLTHHLLAADRQQVLALADALRAIKEQIRPLPAMLQPDRRRPVCRSVRDPRRDADGDLRGRAAARPGRPGTDRQLSRACITCCTAGSPRWTTSARSS